MINLNSVPIVKDPLAEAMRLAPKEGVFAEFGVGSGASLRRLAAERFTLGFDSFEGLPEDWRPGFPKGMFKCDPPVLDNTRLVIGPFSKTTDQEDTWLPCALLHVDCDLYESTLWALSWFSVDHMPNAIIVFDEFYGYPGHERHEMRALEESGLVYEPLFRSDENGQKFVVRVP